MSPIKKHLATIQAILWCLISFSAMAAETKDSVWSLVENSIKRHPTYKEVVDQLPDLIDSKDIQVDGRNRIIAGGYIVITQHSIASYKDPADFKKSMKPEYEVIFGLDAEEKPKSYVEMLKGVRIALDVIPTHQYFKMVGELSYETFIVKLQNEFKRALKDAGAHVQILRPEEPKLTTDLFDKINQKPPHIVLSPQFNNDHQDCMTIFCGGNISAKELESPRVRARFVQAALTQKCSHSIDLGVRIVKCCQDKLGVSLLPWDQGSFEGNAAPVSASYGQSVKLETKRDFCSGVLTRNLFLNDAYAHCVVTPFPDMQWVAKQVAKDGNPEKWIKDYVAAVTQGIIDYVKENPSMFMQ
jgi:hypothetical protein